MGLFLGFVVGDFCFYEFVPSADAVVGFDVAFGVFYLVGFEDFFEVKGLKIAGGVDNCAAFHSQGFVVGY